MTTLATNVSGIQDPVATEDLTPTNAFAGVKKLPTNNTASNLNKNLATIQGLSSGITEGGLGQTLGGVAGTALGTGFGGPIGSVVGGSIGQSLGSIVDFGLGKSERDRRRRQDLSARRKQIAREKRLANSKRSVEQKMSIQGISNQLEQDSITKDEVLANQRENLLGNIMNSINKKANFNDFLKSKFIEDRSVV